MSVLERKKKEEPVVVPVVDAVEPLVWFRNGGKSFRINRNRIIKPNQTFQAKASEIPLAFRDIVKPVGTPAPRPGAKPVPPPPVGSPGKKMVEPITPVRSEYKAVKDEETGEWNILDPQGVVINEKPFSDEHEAQDLAKSLSN
jgi:hypothetical protein